MGRCPGVFRIHQSILRRPGRHTASRSRSCTDCTSRHDWSSELLPIRPDRRSRRSGSVGHARKRSRNRTRRAAPWPIAIALWFLSTFSISTSSGFGRMLVVGGEASLLNGTYGVGCYRRPNGKSEPKPMRADGSDCARVVSDSEDDRDWRIDVETGRCVAANC